MRIGTKPASKNNRSRIVNDMVANVGFLIVVDTGVMGKKWPRLSPKRLLPAPDPLTYSVKPPARSLFSIRIRVEVLRHTSWRRCKRVKVRLAR
jgi:hypothetical protein